ncbi:MAG: PhnD/SsuA/transferrin family substrate-binding protein [Verrucomicrobiaceae bacterium]|nr:PhnD/SsuA/transferrin family substrate-binding protein [Verrucomicrobiaceae bacterium]
MKLAILITALLAQAAFAADKLAVLVMDPLSKDLACDCVKGYAQRNYRVLAAHLQQKLGAEVTVHHAETLAAALKDMPKAPDIIIGKQSVVLSEAAKNKLGFAPVARLTGKDGSASQQGFIVVRHDSPLKKVSDLQGVRIIFGPADCDEKNAAILALLKQNGITPPDKLETASSCSAAAEVLMKLPKSEKAAGVISSYAEPLLSGCGTIKKGDLVVIGKTSDVPFITAFTSDKLSAEYRKAITEALLDTGGDPELLQIMESLLGFIGLDEPDANTPPKKPLSWHQFRGPHRDGTVEWLPEKLPGSAAFAWQADLPSDGIGGLVATENVVIASCRDTLDESDVWLCLDASSGRERWRYVSPAPARTPLDYGNSPRATPLIAEGRLFLLGAFGHLHCLDLSNGELIWTSHLPLEFGAPLPKWGHAASPLLIDKKLIVQPGGAEASIIALDPETADLIWHTPGRRAAYASLIHATVNGKPQLIGLDEKTVGAWAPATGKRLWEHTPPNTGDFNVPTPLFNGTHLYLSSESNGTRIHAFDAEGKLIAKPLAMHEDLSPDSHTPVLAAGRLIGFHTDLHFLDAKTLKPLATLDDRAFGVYASLITDGRRLITLSEKGMLLLHDLQARELGRLKLCDPSTHVLSHPALVGNRLYLRLGERIACLVL